MRGNCGVDDLTLLTKPCVYNGNAVALTDAKAIDTLNEFCPGLKTGKEIKYLDLINVSYVNI